jgi:hypothetical protein
MFTCDKCGRPVGPRNDAVRLQFVLQTGHLPHPIDQLVYGARHLLPIGGCEGSPSRAQYLEGQPRDTRGYPLVAANVGSWRRAYRRLWQLV